MMPLVIDVDGDDGGWFMMTDDDGVEVPVMPEPRRRQWC
jgi:hypothetical protein